MLRKPIGRVALCVLGCLSASCSEADPAKSASSGGAAFGGATDTGGNPSTGGTAQGSGGSTQGAGGSGRASGGNTHGAGGSGGRASGGGAQGLGGSSAGGAMPTSGDTLTARYPDDTALAADPAVLFHDDFEQGWGKWDAPSKDTAHLFIESKAATAHSGARYLRSTVTQAQLEKDQYISSATQFAFKKRVDTVYWRFYARFVGVSVTPHHWVRMAAGTEAYDSSGLANTVPPGDQGFWFDFDADTSDRFNFYVYWYKMRSGRCNDGSTTPGCAGDQGTTYHYGNTFAPATQTPFPRDTWICIELMAKANTVGTSDGALAFFVNNAVLGDYRPGFPDGTWLRDRFHPGGCTFSACEPPKPFEGFDFRSSSDVRFKKIFLDAYYERDSTASRRAELEARGLTVASEQTVLYDDVVVATSRIGCGKFPAP